MDTYKHWSVVVLWLGWVVSVHSAGTYHCPRDCVCTESTSEGLAIRCQLSTAISPLSFPHHARIVEVTFLRSNPPVDILNGSFASLGNVELLKVKGEIGNIRSGAFFNLTGGVTNTTAVTKLHLWTAKILRVEERAFQGIHHFETVEISASQIGELQSNAFSDINNIGEVKLWNTNITHASAYSFSGFRNIKSLTMKSMKVDHLPNGAFMGVRTVESFEAWKMTATCMGPLAFAGMEKVENAEFSSCTLPSVPLLSWKNAACVTPQGFTCMNASDKINMSRIRNNMDVCCLKDSPGDWRYGFDYASSEMTHIRYTVGFVCGGMLFFILLGLYMGNRTACNRKNKVWHHPRWRFGRTLGLPIAAVSAHRHGRNVPRRGARRSSEVQDTGVSANVAMPPGPPHEYQHNTSYSPVHQATTTHHHAQQDIFYTSNPEMALPSYEDCLKIPPAGPLYEIPLSPPPPYMEDNYLGDIHPNHVSSDA